MIEEGEDRERREIEEQVERDRIFKFNQIYEKNIGSKVCILLKNKLNS